MKKIKLSKQARRAPVIETATITGSSGSFATLLAKLDADDARDAGMPLREWLALTEIEKIRRWEDFQDGQFAGPRETLQEYRSRKRLAFEAGELRDEYGMPMWLRTAYAQEDPQKIAAELARLVFHGMSATGDLLKQTIAAMECRTRRGWLGTGLGFAELKLRVEEEIDRLGIAQQFNEELAKLAARFAERNIQ
jgi:hypothetical protein